MIAIPDGVNLQVSGNELIAKGPAGEVRKSFKSVVKIKIENKSVQIDAPEKELTNTVEALITNMCNGAKIGFKKHFKLIYAHFPITIEVKGKDVTVKNFLGEKQPRKTVLIGNTKIESKGQNVTVSGPDKEAVGQTVANMRTAMKIKEKDGRIFQDGIYEIEGESS